MITQDLEVTPAAANARLAATPKAFLIDVREPEEFTLARIDGARLIPMATIVSELRQLEQTAREGDLLLICHHGVRSMQVVQWLRSQGIENCFSVAGGIDRWSYEVDESVGRY